MIERWTGAPAPAIGRAAAPSPLERHRLPLTAFFALLAVLGAAVWLARQPVAPPIAIPTPLAGSRLIKVHVTGAVAQPGLYELADGARVADALDLAGGALQTGDATRLNLALRLRDGQQVAVPSTAMPASVAQPTTVMAARPGRLPTPHSGARVNLNSATQADLELLPGIGPATAKKILDYRQEKGPFQTPQELKDARLVTNAAWTRLAELVDAP